MKYVAIVLLSPFIATAVIVVSIAVGISIWAYLVFQLIAEFRKGW